MITGERDIEIRSTLPVSPGSTGWLQLITFHGNRNSVDLQASILQSHNAVRPYAGAILLADGCINVWKCFGNATSGLQLSNKNGIIYNIIIIYNYQNRPR